MSEASRSPPDPPGRVAAVDYGRRRIGIALSDALRITVRGLDTIRLEPTRSGPPDPDRAATLVAERLRDEAPARVVVGLPLHMSGEESDMSREARRFGGALARALGVPVVYHDEGLTSWAAEEDVKAAGRSLGRARREGDVDRRAAVALLRSYLAG